jgi:ADP-ribose pyrophosphatase YjhB (NUDIX family)
MNEINYCPRCGKRLIEQEKFGDVRQCCPDTNCGFIHFLDPKVVAVVLVEHQGQLLLGRRAIDPGRGLWSFSGGYVNRGEKVEAAALREVKEETNLDIALGELLGVYSEEANPVILVVYRGRVKTIEALRPQDEEVMELAFFNPAEIPALAFPFDETIVAAWLKAREKDLV